MFTDDDAITKSRLTKHSQPASRTHISNIVLRRWKWAVIEKCIVQARTATVGIITIITNNYSHLDRAKM